MKTTQQRIFGLDILRAVAIITVMYGHFFHVLPVGIDPFYARLQEFDGVTLFFTLSGFLIGGILLRTLHTQKRTLESLKRFWRDRWLRTIPAYLVVLILNIVLGIVLNDLPLSYHIAKYFVFLQNVMTAKTSFFTESWSLAVEEWFYLIIPILFFLSNKRYLPFIIILIILGVTGFRTWKITNFQIETLESFAYQIMMTIPTRLDAIMFGVLGAYFSFHQFRFWTEWKNQLFAVGIIGLISNHFIYTFIGESIYTFHFYLPLGSLFTLCVLPKLSTIKTGKGLVAQVITFVALISYSLYLVHFSLGILLLRPYVIGGPIVRVITYLLFSFTSAYLLYSLIEKMGLRWRDRIKQKENGSIQLYEPISEGLRIKEVKKTADPLLP